MPDEFSPDLGGLEPDYQIQTELRHSRRSRTFLARHLGLNRDVTIQVLGTPGNDNDNSLTLFASDARALSVIRHPNVVPVLEARWLAGGTFAVVRPRVRGMVDRRDRCDRRSARGIARRRRARPGDVGRRVGARQWDRPPRIVRRLGALSAGKRARARRDGLRSARTGRRRSRCVRRRAHDRPVGVRDARWASCGRRDRRSARRAAPGPSLAGVSRTEHGDERRSSRCLGRSKYTHRLPRCRLRRELHRPPAAPRRVDSRHR